jgi:uroporphyrinogen decarboxylase
MKAGVPVIHFGTGTHSLLEGMTRAGGTVIGLDWRTPLAEGWARVGHDKAVQGNLDPIVLQAPIAVAKEHARRVLDAAKNRDGHVFNLGHGILPSTPEDSVKAIVDFVHEQSAR